MILINKIRDANLLGIATGIMYTLTYKLLNLAENILIKDRRKHPLFKKKNQKHNSKLRPVVLTEAINFFKGYLISQLITKTGRGLAPLKGAGMGAFYWLGAMGITKKVNQPLKDLTSGVFAGLFVENCADAELFPYQIPQPQKTYKLIRRFGRKSR